MKKTLLLLAFTASVLSLAAQQTMNVKLKVHYKGSPMCNWNVTIKHGDATIAQGKTDKNGVVEYKYARLLSRAIDVYGDKTFQGGDKHWDVKGYVTLDDNGYADLDFDPIVQEIGMPSMLENAWGLTINDCGSSAATSPSTAAAASGTTNNTASASSAGATASNAASEPVKPAQPVKTQEEQTAEGYENVRTMHLNKIATLDSKIRKRTQELEKTTAGSEEWSDLSYDIKDLELEKAITQVKLEKTEKQIAKGYKPLEKYEKIPLDDKEDQLSEEQKALKRQQKDGVPYGGTKAETATASVTGTGEETAGTKTYTTEELAAMSVFNLKKLKLDLNSTITKRKLTLKTKAAFLKPAEKTAIEAEIVLLEQQVQLVGSEIAKRSAEE